MKRSQSAIEAAVLIGFMSFTLLIFLAIAHQKTIESQKEVDTQVLGDLVGVIETELNLAAGASDGYYRVFELPAYVNGKDYSMTFIDSDQTEANFTEVEIRYANQQIFYNSVTPGNIFGSLCKGDNIVIKNAGIINISCVECSNLYDDDGNGCSDFPLDKGCRSPDDFDESGGVCTTQCNDGMDNDFNGCADDEDSACETGSSEEGGNCQCDDGTSVGQCGQNGRFCNGAGELVDACGPPNNCACSPGFSCQGNSCVPDTLGCSVSTSCTGADLFHLSNRTNAHAQISSLSNYPFKVCCSTAVPISASCVNPDTILASMSSNTNAHLEKKGFSDYPTDICMSADNLISCTYVDAPGNGYSVCANAGKDTCAFTISGDTNAHAGDCITDPYNIKVCCSLPSCGDSVCNGAETCGTCVGDCGSCANTPPVITSLTDSPDPQTSGSSITFSSTVNDPDGQTQTLFVYSDAAATNQLAASSVQALNPSAVFTCPSGWPSGNGPIQYFAKAYDGQAFSQVFSGETFTCAVLDSTPPVTTFSVSSSITLSCSDTGSGCMFTKYCTDNTNTCVPTTTYTSSIAVSGNDFIRYYSQDNAGNIEATKSVSVPTISNAFVLSGTCNSGEVITIACDATDPAYASSTLEVLLYAGQCVASDCFNTRSWATGTGTTYHNPASMSYASANRFTKTLTVNQPVGTSIAATCHSANPQGAISNWGDAYPICTVGGCTNPPTFSAVSALPNPAKAETITITFTASKALASNPTVTIKPQGSATEYPATFSSVNGLNYQYVFAITSAHADGQAEIRVEGSDAQSCAGSSIGTFTIDKTAPLGTVTINSGSATTSSASVTLGLSCSDSIGCSQMQFSSDGTTYSAPEAFASSKSLTFSSGDGLKTAYAKYKDSSGNWMSTPATDTITLDTTPPLTTINSPATGSIQTADFTPSVTDTDATSGISSCYYSVEDTGRAGLEINSAARTCGTFPSISVGSNGICRTSGTNTCAFSAWAIDNAQNTNSPSSRILSINTCSLSVAAISLSDTNGNSKADAGESVSMTGSTTGDCSSLTHFQIDAKSADNSCLLQFSGGHISGIFSVPGASIAGSWTIPSIPQSCEGKTVSATAAGLYRGGTPNPGSGRNVAFTSSVSGGFTFKYVDADTLDSLHWTTGIAYPNAGYGIKEYIDYKIR